MAISIEQFTKQLTESGLMSVDDLNSVLAAMSSPGKVDGEVAARLLVKHKKLTAFQAQEVYSARGKGLVLGNYVVLDKLGQGGMGMVLKAEHRRMKRAVAIKVLSPKVTKNAEAVRRFQREVEAAAKLRHTNIVAADDADESNGTHFLVMEYIEGSDLSALVKKQGAMSLDKALHCVLQAARGLEYAHNRGVVHRDIKPSNLLLDNEGTVKILDMGLARLESAGSNQDELTGTGQIMGTVDYMAPEQAMSTKNADARADIYALGITFWYLLSGRAMYAGETAIEKLMAHQTKPIPSLAESCSAVTPALQAVFEKMVAKTPAARYQTMTEVIAGLEACRDGSSPSVPTVKPATPAPPSKPAAPVDNSRASDFLKSIGSPGPVHLPPTAMTSVHLKSATSQRAEVTLNTGLSHSDTDPKTEDSLPIPLTFASLIQTRSAPAIVPQPRPKKSPTMLIAAGVGGFLVLLAIGAWALSRRAPRQDVGTTTLLPAANVPAQSSLTPKVETPVPLATSTNVASPNNARTTKTSPKKKDSYARTAAKGNPFGSNAEPTLAVKRFPSDQWVEIIPLISPGLDSLSVPNVTGANDWRIVNNELVYKGDSRYGKMLFPVKYSLPTVEWEIEFTRTAGKGNFVTDMLAKGGIIPIMLDESANGFLFVGATGQRVLSSIKVETGKRAKLRILSSLAAVDRLQFFFNDQAAGSWSGQFSTLVKNLDEGYDPAERHGIFVPRDTSFTFHRIRVRGVQGSEVETLRPIADASTSTSNEPGWKSIFNGQSLTGWTTQGYPGWTVENGILTGWTIQQPGWLMSNDVYADFELEFEYKLAAESNSGIFLRAFPSGTISGAEFHEVQILDDASPKHRTLLDVSKNGAIYRQLAPKNVPPTPAGEWHQMRIRLYGLQVQVTLNDVPIVDGKLTAGKPSQGNIGLQLYPTQVQFRNLRVRSLKPDGTPAG